MISRGTSQPGIVTVRLSDPATCEAPSGPYRNIYVTLVDVQAHTSSTASETDSGWVDLTPDLKNNPKQIDLLGTSDAQCFLSTLASGTQVAAGNYQQIRLILADNGASAPAGNKCGPAANCLVLDADGSVHTLQLSSEARTGIKIPSGQIAGGRFQVPSGETRDLNIDFNACASIVIEGNGRFRLKPVLHAGAVSLVTNSISGKVTDSVTHVAIAGGTTIVALEQRDAAGVNRVIMETVADATGNFVFCPVPEGTYDIVAVAVNGVGLAYAATVVTGVQPGNNVPDVPLVAQGAPGTAQGSITGQVTTSKAGPAATGADVTLSALQQITVGGSPVMVTVPLAQQSAATANLATAADAGCPTNTGCASYTLQVPAANPSVGAFGPAITFTQDTAAPVAYTVEARAFVPLSGATANCSPSSLSTSTASDSTALVVASGATVTASTLGFTGCQ